MKYTVHLYTAVRIRMEDIEANSQEEAAAKAMEECDVKHNLAHGYFEDDEAPFLGAMVDEEGDEENYLNSRYHEGTPENYLSTANAALLKIAPQLLAVLEEIVGPLDKPDQYGYGAAFNAMNDDIRNRARALVAEARGEK